MSAMLAVTLYRHAHPHAHLEERESVNEVSVGDNLQEMCGGLDISIKTSSLGLSGTVVRLVVKCAVGSMFPLKLAVLDWGDAATADVTYPEIQRVRYLRRKERKKGSNGFRHTHT